MKNSPVNSKKLLRLNLISIFIIAACEIFALTEFFRKAFHEEVARWKFIVYIAIVVTITVFLIGAIISFLHFFKIKKKD